MKCCSLNQCGRNFDILQIIFRISKKNLPAKTKRRRSRKRQRQKQNHKSDDDRKLRSSTKKNHNLQKNYSSPFLREVQSASTVQSSSRPHFRIDLSISHRDLVLFFERVKYSGPWVTFVIVKRDNCATARK